MRHFQTRFSVVHVVILLALCFITFFALAGPNGEAVGHEKISPGLAKLMERYEALQDFDTCLSIAQIQPSMRAAALLHSARALAGMNRSADAKKRLDEAVQLDQKHKVFSETQRTEAKQLLESLGA